jgi:hypothetical protein
MNETNATWSTATSSHDPPFHGAFVTRRDDEHVLHHPHAQVHDEPPVAAPSIRTFDSRDDARGRGEDSTGDAIEGGEAMEETQRTGDSQSTRARIHERE